MDLIVNGMKQLMCALQNNVIRHQQQSILKHNVKHFGLNAKLMHQVLVVKIRFVKTINRKVNVKDNWISMVEVVHGEINALKKPVKVHQMI